MSSHYVQLGYKCFYCNTIAAPTAVIVLIEKETAVVAAVVAVGSVVVDVDADAGVVVLDVAGMPDIPSRKIRPFLAEVHVASSVVIAVGSRATSSDVVLAALVPVVAALVV